MATTELIFKAGITGSSQSQLEYWTPNRKDPDLIFSKSSLETLISHIAARTETAAVFHEDLIKGLETKLAKHRKRAFTISSTPPSDDLIAKIGKQIKKIATIIYSQKPSIEPSSLENEPVRPLSQLLEEYKKKLGELENFTRSAAHPISDHQLAKYKILFNFLQSRLISDEILATVILRYINKFNKILALTPSPSTSTVSKPLSELQDSLSLYEEKIELLEKFLKDHFHDDISKAKIFNKIILAHKKFFLLLRDEPPPEIDVFCLTHTISRCVQDINEILNGSPIDKRPDPKQHLVISALVNYNIKISLLEKLMVLEKRKNLKISMLINEVRVYLETLQTQVPSIASSIQQNTLTIYQNSMLTKAFPLLKLSSAEIIDAVYTFIDALFAKNYLKILKKLLINK